MANSKTATFGTYSVRRDENNKITITKDGQLCNNTMAAIREIAGQCGFELNPGWNTQQSGAKLIAFLEEKNPQATAELEVGTQSNEGKANNETFDRGYWLANSSEEYLNVMDAMMDVINEASSNKYEPRYNSKMYIGLTKDEKPSNFLTFCPQKKALKLSVKIEEGAQWNELLKSHFPSSWQYKDGWYQLSLQLEDTEKSGGFFKKLMGKSTSKIEALKPLLLQSEADFRKKKEPSVNPEKESNAQKKQTVSNGPAVEIESYSIEKQSDGSYYVTINGQICSNAKGAMRQIAAHIGFEYDPGWTTQQFGAKLSKVKGNSTPEGTQQESMDTEKVPIATVEDENLVIREAIAPVLEAVEPEEETVEAKPVESVPPVVTTKEETAVAVNDSVVEKPVVKGEGKEKKRRIISKKKIPSQKKRMQRR